MSARAAWRLESLGFTDVYRYTAGKTDWFASGLPRAGKLTGFPTAGDALRRDVPTCRPGERVGAAAGRARGAGWDMCPVVNDQRVVLGVLRKRALDGDPDRPVEEAMELGPTTFRPNELLAELALHLTQAGVRHVLITTGDGELLGVLDRAEAIRRTGGAEPSQPRAS
jgi:CBS domain-containing protein